jgi:hypothetical protein
VKGSGEGFNDLPASPPIHPPGDLAPSENGSAGSRLTPFDAAPARRTAIADAVPREVVFTFANGWRLARVPRSEWPAHGVAMGHCFADPNHCELYDDAPRTQGTTPWTILALETPNGRPRLTVGFVVTLATSEVVLELSLPAADRAQTKIAGASISEFLAALELTRWKAVCRGSCLLLNKGASVEAEFDWAAAGYDGKTLRHRCPTCGCEFLIQRAASTESFTRILGEAMAQRAAEVEKG